VSVRPLRTRTNKRFLIGSASNIPSFLPKFNSASLFCLAIALLFSGCKKKEHVPIEAAQVHAITRELLRVAAGVIKEPSSIHSRFEFDGVHADRADQLIMVMPGQVSEQGQRETLARLMQALDRVATAHHLTRDAAGASGPVRQLNYRHENVLTHSVEFKPRDTASKLGPPLSNPQRSGTSRLAIILDDLGSDGAAAAAVFALPYPLTISVLPDHPHSIDIANEAHRRGYQVMLHLPMQSVSNEKPESAELHPGMSAREVTTLVDRFVHDVPNVNGVNNHQGSQSTTDPKLMAELMPVLRERHLFYIDSRTTAETVAYDTAQRLGVRSAFRNVPFLDDIATIAAVRTQLDLALRGAQQKGEAIAIGHPRPATLQALREVLPQAKAQGVHLVFASDLVH
jgi:polysaccharide deacetylase 2 family uncharacterized protein YibQ